MFVQSFPAMRESLLLVKSKELLSKNRQSGILRIKVDPWPPAPSKAKTFWENSEKDTLNKISSLFILVSSFEKNHVFPQCVSCNCGPQLVTAHYASALRMGSARARNDPTLSDSWRIFAKSVLRAQPIVRTSVIETGFSWADGCWDVDWKRLPGLCVRKLEVYRWHSQNG